MSRLVEVVITREAGAPATSVARAGVWAWVSERRAVVAALVLLAVFGFGMRASGVGQIGFAEDEINKLDAVRAYARGDITPNAEHPMLMKSLIFVSVQAAQKWNAGASSVNRISDEAAVRFPNILLGALTIFPLFLLAASLFDRRTALVAAALWAFGVNAVTYNRIAKEDTLLVFFMLFAFYFYVRAKQMSGFEAATKNRHYVLSAVSFGLMLASKYFPHYFGLNMLFHHLVRLREREPGEPRGRTPRIFYAVLAVAFVVANPALFAPQTWEYLRAYSGEGLLTHHGYLMGETLYHNTMSKTPFGGTPFYFYLLFLAIKVPLPLIVAFLAGLVETVRRRRREPGAVFLLLMFGLWIVPYSLVGAKWLRYALSLMPLFYMIAAVGVVALVRLASRLAKQFTVNPSAARVAVWAFALAVFVAAPAAAALARAPHYALYTNALASARAGYFFPHDEFYDDGLREAIKFVAERAPRGGTIAHETPGVARYYLERFGREDLQSRVVSDSRFDARRAPAGNTFVVLQRGRTYFENEAEAAAVRSGAGGFVKIYEGRIGGAVAVEVYSNIPAGSSPDDK